MSQNEPKPIGMATLSDGTVVKAYFPSFGDLIDRVANASAQPVSMATIPALCIKWKEEAIRALSIEDGIKVMDACQPAERIITDYFKRVNNVTPNTYSS